MSCHVTKKLKDYN